MREETVAVPELCRAMMPEGLLGMGDLAWPLEKVRQAAPRGPGYHGWYPGGTSVDRALGGVDHLLCLLLDLTNRLIESAVALERCVPGQGAGSFFETTLDFFYFSIGHEFLSIVEGGRDPQRCWQCQPRFGLRSEAIALHLTSRKMLRKCGQRRKLALTPGYFCRGRSARSALEWLAAAESPRRQDSFEIPSGFAKANRPGLEQRNGK